LVKLFDLFPPKEHTFTAKFLWQKGITKGNSIKKSITKGNAIKRALQKGPP
jgi:hypothetical protein